MKNTHRCALLIQSGKTYHCHGRPLQNFQSSLFLCALRYDSFYLPPSERQARSLALRSGTREQIVRSRWKSTRGFSSISSSQSTRRVVDSAVPAISLSRIVFPSVAWKSHQQHTIVNLFPSFARSFLLWSSAQLPMHVGNPHTEPPCPCTVLCDVTMETGWAQSLAVTLFE